MVNDGTNWTCPYCDRDQVITSSTYATNFVAHYVGETNVGAVGTRLVAIRCSNHVCNKVTLSAQLVPAVPTPKGGLIPKGNAKPFHTWQLLPDSMAKPQPEYIPAPLREDYFEACLIREKSPKASATLARRCLQGMIRDFCGIAKGTLAKEIEELRDRVAADKGPRSVEPEHVEAIDAVRKIGNIGAHMERDIGLIIDVDPGEARALIELIEMLFSEWYVARFKRDERLEKVKTIAAGKDAKKTQLVEEKRAALELTENADGAVAPADKQAE